MHNAHYFKLAKIIHKHCSDIKDEHFNPCFTVQKCVLKKKIEMLDEDQTAEYMKWKVILNHCLRLVKSNMKEKNNRQTGKRN